MGPDWWQSVCHIADKRRWIGRNAHRESSSGPPKVLFPPLWTVLFGHKGGVRRAIVAACVL